MSASRYNARSARSLSKIICSGASIFTLQKARTAPARRNAPSGTSFMVAPVNGVPTTRPAMTERMRIVSCLGLTQTTLSGIPRLDQRVGSLNQRMRTMAG